MSLKTAKKLRKKVEMNIIKKSEMDYPIMLGFPTETQVMVWCPHCKMWHYHGKENGHRVGHCANIPGREHLLHRDYIVQAISKTGAKELIEILAKYVGEK